MSQQWALGGCREERLPGKCELSKDLEIGISYQLRKGCPSKENNQYMGTEAGQDRVFQFKDSQGDSKEKVIAKGRK